MLFWRQNLINILFIIMHWIALLHFQSNFKFDCYFNFILVKIVFFSRNLWDSVINPLAHTKSYMTEKLLKIFFSHCKFPFLSGGSILRNQNREFKTTTNILYKCVLCILNKTIMIHNYHDTVTTMIQYNYYIIWLPWFNITTMI